jgi:hypothetical protein
MTSVSPPQQITSAFTVTCGAYGAVTRYAHQRGRSRQAIYREAAQVLAALDPARADAATAWQRRAQELEQQVQALQARLAQALVLDDDQQAEFATVGQARGVSLPDCQALLEVLAPGQVLSVASLGRRTQAAGQRAGELLAVFDVYAQAQARHVAADEIYVRAPVLMVLEQDSLCWLGGRLSASVDGDAWAAEFGRLPHLEQVACDGGGGLRKGLAVLNAARAAQQRDSVVRQGDLWHVVRGGGPGLRQAQQRAAQALAAAEDAERVFRECQWQGRPIQGARHHANVAWRRAEQAFDSWSAQEQSWQRAQTAFDLVTPAGELNTRAQAQAVLAATLATLPEGGFGKVKRQLQQPDLLNHLDLVQQRLAALPYAAAVTEAAVRQEALRRRPELARGEGAPAAAVRGVLLLCAVLLGKAEAEGRQAVAAVREIFRRAYRASSLVECLNSVLRMQQARHRQLTQGLLDLKRLYWNSHEFRTGRRRKQTPYQLLGVPWPEGLRWWEVLKLTPEQLQEKLSAPKLAA